MHCSFFAVSYNCAPVRRVALVIVFLLVSRAPRRSLVCLSPRGRGVSPWILFFPFFFLFLFFSFFLSTVFRGYARLR